MGGCQGQISTLGPEILGVVLGIAQKNLGVLMKDHIFDPCRDVKVNRLV